LHSDVRCAILRGFIQLGDFMVAMTTQTFRSEAAQAASTSRCLAAGIALSLTGSDHALVVGCMR
jgi:hypothetical protein